METMEVLGVDPGNEVESDNKPQNSRSPSPSQSGGKTNVTSRNPIYPAIMPAPQSTTAADEANSPPQTKPSFLPPESQDTGSQPSSSSNAQASGTTSSIDKSRRKRKGLTPEQKEKLQAIQQEQETIRKERVAMLSQKLLQKISVWIETDRGATVTQAFKKKMEVCQSSRVPNCSV